MTIYFKYFIWRYTILFRYLHSLTKNTIFNLAPNEEEYPTWKKREKVLLTVEDWLTYIGLGKYINNFINNGYDDLNFLGEDVITCKQDLVDIGISDEKDSSHLLESLKKKGNSAGMT